MALTVLTVLGFTVSLAHADSGSTDFVADAGGWIGGSMENGKLVLDGERVLLELGEADSLSLRVRVRQVDAGKLELSLGASSWTADYAGTTGVSLGEEAVPMAPDHRTWVPDTQPLIVPTGSGWMGADALHCEIIEYDGTFYLFWTGAMAPGYGYRQIGVATSPDAENWTPYAANPVLTIDYDHSTVDGIQVHMPTVVVDPDNGAWSMFYSCYQNGVGNRICRATSPDGLTWTPREVALDFGGEGEFDSGSLRMPDVLIDGSGTWHMLYNGTVPGEHYGPAGYATSADGQNWTKHGAIEADGDRLQGGGMLQTAYGIEQWWNCADAFCASVADPSDWSVWEDREEPILVKNWAAWNSGYIQSPSPLQLGQELHMWFNAYDYQVDDEVITHAKAEPKAGVWMDLSLSWDGETLQVQQDQGPTLSLVAPGGTLSVASTGRVEMDSAQWSWEPTPEPQDTDPQETGDSSPVDTGTEDSDPVEFPRIPGDSGSASEPGCGCSGGAGSGLWLLAFGFLFRRRSRKETA